VNAQIPVFLRSSGKRVKTQSLRTVEESKEDVGCWTSKNALMAAVVLRTKRIVRKGVPKSHEHPLQGGEALGPIKAIGC